MEHFAESEIINSFLRIKTIVNCGIFNTDQMQHPLRESAFIELMICTRDLMAKTEKYSERISFSDDVNLVAGVENVSDAISKVRNAICHINSPLREVGDTNNRVSFACCAGKMNFMKIGDIELKSEYEDDICFFYGHHKLYLKRHILKAIDEAKQKLLPHLRENIRRVIE